jgi:hypothetical protein
VGQAKLKAGAEAPAFRLSVNVGGQISGGGLARIALSAKAKHGGIVMTAGEYSVELVVSSPKLVQAFVVDASGKAHVKGDLKLGLAVAGAPALKLEWNAGCGCYQAEVDAKVDLQSQPIKLEVGGQGRVRVAGVASPKARAGAAADVKARADLPAPKLRADAKAKAGATVKPPSVNLSVGKKGGAKASGKAGISLGTK